MKLTRRGLFAALAASPLVAKLPTTGGKPKPVVPPTPPSWVYVYGCKSGTYSTGTITSTAIAITSADWAYYFPADTYQWQWYR
jgi:hypothetical protein